MFDGEVDFFLGGIESHSTSRASPLLPTSGWSRDGSVVLRFAPACGVAMENRSIHVRLGMDLGPRGEG